MNHSFFIHKFDVFYVTHSLVHSKHIDHQETVWWESGWTLFQCRQGAQNELLKNEKKNVHSMEPFVRASGGHLLGASSCVPLLTVPEVLHPWPLPQQSPHGHLPLTNKGTRTQSGHRVTTPRPPSGSGLCWKSHSSPIPLGCSERNFYEMTLGYHCSRV